MSNKLKLSEISTGEAQRVGVSSLADRPTGASRYGDGGLTAQGLKERFDALPNFVRDRFNAIAQMLAGTDAAKYIGLDGSVGGVDNLYDFLLLFGARGDGAQDKNISDYIETLYDVPLEDADGNENYSRTLKDIVQSIVSRFADVETNKGAKVELVVEEKTGEIKLRLLNAAGVVLGDEQKVGPVKTAGIADGAVTKDKLASKAVSLEKLGEDVRGKIEYFEDGDLTEVTYNAKNGKLTFFAKNGKEKATVNLPLDLVVSGGEFDKGSNDIVLVLSNGSKISIPLDDFVDTAIAEIKRIDARIPKPTSSDEGRFLKASGEKIVFSDIGDYQFPKLRAPLSVTVDSHGMTVTVENREAPFILKNYVYIDGERVGTVGENLTFNFSEFVDDKASAIIGVAASAEGFAESDKTLAEWWSQNGTEGLTYSGQTCTGIGAATESEIEIASYHNGDPVLYIAIGAFRDCTALTSVKIPNTVEDIGRDAFYGCTALKSIIIPESVTDIHNSAFYGCKSLESITMSNIKKYVGEIGNNTFYGCEALKSITIPYGATYLGDCAFKGCSSLTSVTIPDSVTTIYSESFAGCSSLTSVTIPDSVIRINSTAFRDCKALTSITIPGGVKTIGSYTFYGCTALTDVTISEGVEFIGYYAFEGCSSLTSITIPASVTNFSPRVFLNCSSLKTVIFKGTPTSIASAVFENCTSLTDIYVPWSEGAVANAPWGATNATIHYNSEG